MPWAAPIGTGQGPRNARGLRELRERTPHITMIIDAGIGIPSHACQVMEWGFDGVLLNTAISRAIDPVRMAGAFSNAIRAGFLPDQWSHKSRLWRVRLKSVAHLRRIQFISHASWRLISRPRRIGRCIIPVFTTECQRLAGWIRSIKPAKDY